MRGEAGTGARCSAGRESTNGSTVHGGAGKTRCDWAATGSGETRRAPVERDQCTEWGVPRETQRRPLRAVTVEARRRSPR